MASRSLLFTVLLFLGITARGAQAQFGLGIITGIVPCNIGNGINAATSPVFPNAGVQLTCGGKVIASVTTNSKGAFAIPLDLTTTLLTTLLSGCDLVVDTPLATCNVSLPSVGSLQSPLQLLQGGLIGGLLGRILNLAPSGFSFVPPLG